MYMYRWGVGLAVNGGIRDIGQVVLQSSFQTGRSSNPIYCRIFFLIAFLGEGLTTNVIILCIII